MRCLPQPCAVLRCRGLLRWHHPALWARERQFPTWGLLRRRVGVMGRRGLRGPAKENRSLVHTSRMWTPAASCEVGRATCHELSAGLRNML